MTKLEEKEHHHEIDNEGGNFIESKNDVELKEDVPEKKNDQIQMNEKDLFPSNQNSARSSLSAE